MRRKSKALEEKVILIIKFSRGQKQPLSQGAKIVVDFGAA
jgi:hypothetical protein